MKLDLGVIALSVAAAVAMVKLGVLPNLISATQELRAFGSLLAGVSFASAFTVAPATVVLGRLAQTDGILEVAIFGGVGALLGDLIIFRFVEDRLTRDLDYLTRRSRLRRWARRLARSSWRWVVPVLGALIVASPLPDELGLTLMGLSRMKTAAVIPLSFSLNFLGILTIGLVARSLA